MLIKFPDELREKIYARAGIECISKAELVLRAVNSYLNQTAVPDGSSSARLKISRRVSGPEKAIFYKPSMMEGPLPPIVVGKLRR